MKKLYNDRLLAALKARQEFLESLSEERKEQAMALQKLITTKLKSAGNPHNRLVLIQQMMLESVNRLEVVLKELRAKLKQTKDTLGNPYSD